MEQIREEQKSLQSSQGFAQALPSAETKWDVSLVRNIFVLNQEPAGSEDLRVFPVLLLHVNGVGCGRDDVPGRNIVLTSLERFLSAENRSLSSLQHHLA